MANQLILDLALPPPTYAREDFVVAEGNREALAWIERAALADRFAWCPDAAAWLAQPRDWGLTTPEGGGIAQVFKVRLIHATGRNLILRNSPEAVIEAFQYFKKCPKPMITAAGKLPIPAGPYVAKADATTGKQIWRTYLDNANVSRRWIGNANLNILDNGNIAFAWANQIVLIDADSGRILRQNTLPAGATAVADVNFKHLTIAPDRTLILKDQTRPTGNTDQGTMAILKGLQAGLKQGNSELVAVNPDTLEVLDHISLPEPATVPHIITMFEGRIAIYVGVNTGALRYFWDPATKKLSQDPSWVVKPMVKGQTTSDAPSILGDWIVLQTNGLGSETVASSIVAVNQKDPSRMRVIFPFGDLKKGEWSWAPPKPQTDPENSMIYSADMGMGKVAGIKIDQATGEMKTVWVVDDTTNAFQPLIGPKDKRVMLLSNARKNVEKEPIKLALFTGNYKEQVTWRDAATGRIIAQSDFFEPLSVGALITPGFGGRVYFPTGKGFIVLQADKAHPMSGSNCICVVTALLETGRVKMVEPETVVKLDTAAGLITARARCKDGRCLSVSLDNVPAFVLLMLVVDYWRPVEFRNPPRPAVLVPYLVLFFGSILLMGIGVYFLFFKISLAIYCRQIKPYHQCLASQKL